jgi:hypothetical protein
MRNRIWFRTSLFHWIASRQASRIRPKRLILGLSLIAALLSWGCPKQDPLQAFNPPKNSPNDPAPAPVPEPVTALLFGAALLIGGGILRRRRNGSHH